MTKPKPACEICYNRELGAIRHCHDCDGMYCAKCAAKCPECGGEVCPYCCMDGAAECHTCHEMVHPKYNPQWGYKAC